MKPKRRGPPRSVDSKSRLQTHITKLEKELKTSQDRILELEAAQADIPAAATLTAEDVMDIVQCGEMEVQDILDDLVIRAKEREASDLNNSGIERQLEYLEHTMGLDDLRSELESERDNYQ